VSKDWFGVFLAEFATETAGRRVALVLDGAGSHRATLPWPDGLVLVSLPPYSPELNTAEQVFRHLHAKLANRVFADLEDLEAALTEQPRALWQQPARLKRLTAYPWWLRGLPITMP
jgi:transposase